MIHTNRVVTVGDQESIIDRPIVLYRGDREVEVEFELIGNEFMFSTEGNVIKSVNASHGQLVLNTPSGDHMFSEVAECHDGKVVFVITKEMIDEFIEMGFYSFQIRLYDGVEMKSRVTIPPVFSGLDIRNPIAAEDETNVVNQAVVDYARIYRDQSNEELPTFTWDGEYNKTEWIHHDVITENKMNKIEDAIWTVNNKISESDNVFLKKAEQMEVQRQNDVNKLNSKDTQLTNDIQNVNRNLTNELNKLKVDMEVGDAGVKNELIDALNENLDILTNDMNELTDGLSKNLERICVYVDDFGAKGDGVTDDTEAIQSAIDYASEFKLGTVMFSNKTYAIRGIDKDNTTGLQGDTDRTKAGIQCKSNVNLVGVSVSDTKVKIIPNSHERYTAFFMRGCKNVKISNMSIQGDTLEHMGTTGEWGAGINCTMSQNIIFENLKITDMWGDGIYVGLSYTTDLYFEDIPRNIVIRNVEIDNVGRNGFSLCTVDTLYVDNLKCSNISRTFPKSGIDIEAEGWSLGFESVLKNIRINNYYAENCLRGIEIFTSKTDIDYDIEINNYTSVNNAQAILCEDRNQNTGHIKINNFYAKGSRYNSITCLNKSNTYRLTIDNINILNNGIVTAADNMASILDRAAISIVCDRDMTMDNGNIHLNNIRIYNDNDTLCRYPIFISCVGSGGTIYNQNGFKFKDIRITNINEFTSLNAGAGGHTYVYTKRAIMENFEIDSRKFIYTGTYPNIRVSNAVRDVAVIADDHINSSRMVCYLNDTGDTFNGAELTFKKSNHLTTEYVINLYELSTTLHGFDNPNNYTILYTRETGAELTVKLLDGEWYVVRKIGDWSIRGGL